MGGSQKIASKKQGVVYYYHTDHLCVVMGMMLGASVAPVLAPEVYGLVLSIIITNPQVVQKATEFVAGTVPGPPPPTPMGYAGAGTEN